MCFWWKDTHIDQCNKIENPEIDFHKFTQHLFDKDEKQLKEGYHFQQMVLEKLDIHD